MASDPIGLRVLVKRAICEQIEAETDASVTVSSSDPGRDLKDRHIFGGDILGTVDYVVMARSEMPHDDQFTIEFACYAVEHDRADKDYIEDEVAAMADAINRAISLNATLEDMDGLFDVLLGSVDGPYTWFTDNGAEGFCTVQVAVHTRVVNT